MVRTAHIMYYLLSLPTQQRSTNVWRTTVAASTNVSTWELVINVPVLRGTHSEVTGEHVPCPVTRVRTCCLRTNVSSPSVHMDGTVALPTTGPEITSRWSQKDANSPLHVSTTWFRFVMSQAYERLHRKTKSGSFFMITIISLQKNVVMQFFMKLTLNDHGKWFWNDSWNDQVGAHMAGMTNRPYLFKFFIVFFTKSAIPAPCPKW